MARRPGGEAVLHARIEAAPGLEKAEAHKLAGFLEGECHLAVVRNNQDDWRCELKVGLRDDDRGILVAAQQSLGLGQLYAKPAHCKSRPQTVWAVSSKVECAALVDLLDAHSFRGRKLKEYEIWREAVSLWNARRYGLAVAAQERMARLAADLKIARQYRPPRGVVAPLVDPYALHYFVGFFSAEGSFGLSARAARFVIKLRRDDRPLLDAFCRDFEMGSLCDVNTPPPWSPAAVWQVTSAANVLRGVGIFDDAVLLGRKKRQFDAWRPGAEAVARATITGTSVDAALVAMARRALSRATAYSHPRDRGTLDPGYSTARTVYIDVLRNWAASTDGPLSCTAYQAARKMHRHWPKRDTIAFAFGGWYEALRCAGLEDRAARRPSVV